MTYLKKIYGCYQGVLHSPNFTLFSIASLEKVTDTSTCLLFDIHILCKSDDWQKPFIPPKVSIQYHPELISEINFTFVPGSMVLIVSVSRLDPSCIGVVFNA